MVLSDIPNIGVESALATKALWYGRLCTVSSSAIIIYDHVITLGDEFRLIWESRWSTGKVLFLMSRYYNVFQVIFNTSSFAWLRWQAVSGIFVYGITEIILMLRLHAMYSSSKGILALMVLGFTAMLIAEIIIIALSTRAEIGAVNANPHIEIPMWKCIQTDTWPLSYLYWLPFLAFETLLFALAIVKGAQSLRDHELKITLCGPHALRALEVLIRDSILYFMLIFAIYLVNVLAWTIEDGRIGEIPVSLAVAVSTVMAQRLLLNIRANFEQRRAGAAMGMDGASTGADSFQLSTMAFDGRFAETGISTSTAVGSVTGDESKIGREKEPGHAFENEMAKEKDAGTGGVRLRTIWTEGLGARGTSIMSGSTVISPTRKYAGYSGHERYQTDSIFQFESEAGPSSPLSYSYASPVTSLAPGHVPPN